MKYIVQVPVVNIKFYSVDADSSAAAIELVSRGERHDYVGSTAGKELDIETWSANPIKLEEPTVQAVRVKLLGEKSGTPRKD